MDLEKYLRDQKKARVAKISCGDCPMTKDHYIYVEYSIEECTFVIYEFHNDYSVLEAKVHKQIEKNKPWSPNKTAIFRIRLFQKINKILANILLGGD